MLLLALLDSLHQQSLGTTLDLSSWNVSLLKTYHRGNNHKLCRITTMALSTNDFSGESVLLLNNIESSTPFDSDNNMAIQLPLVSNKQKIETQQFFSQAILSPMPSKATFISLPLKSNMLSSQTFYHTLIPSSLAFLSKQLP